MAKKMISYTPPADSGVCAKRLDITLEDGVITKYVVTKGCDGNGKSISKLVVGMDAEDVIERLSGITCKHRNSSCGDQLARALKQAIEEG